MFGSAHSTNVDRLGAYKAVETRHAPHPVIPSAQGTESGDSVSLHDTKNEKGSSLSSMVDRLLGREPSLQCEERKFGKHIASIQGKITEDKWVERSKITKPLKDDGLLSENRSPIGSTMLYNGPATLKFKISPKEKTIHIDVFDPYTKEHGVAKLTTQDMDCLVEDLERALLRAGHYSKSGGAHPFAWIEKAEIRDDVPYQNEFYLRQL